MRPWTGLVIAAGLLTGLQFLCAAQALAADAAPDWQSPHYAGHPLAGTVWSGDGKPATRSDLERSAVSSDFVLLGEIHTNPDHHRLQAELLTAMTAAGRKPALVFEMIPAGFQDVLDAFVAAAPASAKGLGPSVDWEGRGWPPWSIYQPVAEAALAAGLPMVAGDLDGSLIREIGRKGRTALSPDQQERLSLSGDLSEPLNAEIREILKQSHCNLLPDPAIEPMLLVQRARDGALAAAMLAAVNGGADGAVLIAGAGHTRRDFAVPRILADRKAGSRIVSVAFVEVDPDMMSLEQYGVSNLYDFTVFTPRADLTDHCAELAERMKGRPEKEPE